MSASPPQFGVRIAHHESETLITVEGELDLSTRPLLQLRINGVLADAEGEVLLDLADVTYIEASDLSNILSARSTLVAQGRVLRVTHVSPQVSRLFELCGATHLLADQEPRGATDCPARSARPSTPPPGRCHWPRGLNRCRTG